MPVVPAPPPTDWRALPKVLLHEHLDGGLRPQTLLALCRERGLSAPAADAAALAGWVQANANSGSLGRYLAGFKLTVEAMASLPACERVAFEAAEDALADGCVLAEFRIAPLLLEAFGLQGEAVVEALLAGLRRSALPCGLIVCAMRHETPAHTLRAARLAGRYAGCGVIGFDLAGAEAGHPPAGHAAAYAAAREAGLGLTCHAGEADVGARVLEAAALGATRIGHGIHIVDDGANLARARELGLHFEVCPSSNVHTGAAASLAAHPLRHMLQAGLSVSLSTDNRLMSGVSLSGELQLMHDLLGLCPKRIRQLQRNAAEASFMPAEQRRMALAAIDAG
jgi:adenosine deaminase